MQMKILSELVSLSIALIVNDARNWLDVADLRLVLSCQYSCCHEQKLQNS